MKGVEFIRRYLLHALAKGFHRIRYRGFLHARGKGKLEWLQLLLNARLVKKTAPPAPVDCIYVCRRCGRAMQAVKHLARAPPEQRNDHFFSRVAA